MAQLETDSFDHLLTPEYAETDEGIASPNRPTDEVGDIKSDAAKEENQAEPRENVIDFSDDKSHRWWDYTFNAKNEYYIHIQFKCSGGHSLSPTANWTKHGARYCYINSKPAQIVSFTDGRLKGKNHSNNYDNQEVITLKQKGNIFKLFFISKSWHFDDGNGIYANVQRVRNGQVKETKK